MQDGHQSGIYCIENTTTGKKYIGQSNNIQSRWSKHKSELKNNKHHNDYLQKAWNKYGQNDFIFYVLEYCEIARLDEREIHYINLYDTLNRDNGYNLTSGGQFKKQYSDDTRNKLSNSIKKSYEDPNRREIQSINALNQWKNPEIKQKIMGKNNAMYGKHHTEEAKQKISKANKGRISYRRNTTPVFCIELNQRFDDATTAGKKLSLDSSAILKVCQGKRKTCGGYTWKFLENGK